MDWDSRAIGELELALHKKHAQMLGSRRTDRRNFSAIWNKYLSSYSVTFLRNERRMARGSVNHALFLNLVEIVNHRNEAVSDALLVKNPDREGQYLLVPRDVAEKILVLGMI